MTDAYYAQVFASNAWWVLERECGFKWAKATFASSFS